MKKPVLSLIITLLATAGFVLHAQRTDEYLGLPGDNLNLYAVMNLFQESETLEQFERDINNKELMINNLDLNGDNFVDYIMVQNYKKGNLHTIVMQVALGEKEKQDVAVFTVQKLRDGSVQIQLIGDPVLYGENYIIEPIFDENTAETPNPGYKGKKPKKKKIRYAGTEYREIADWPLIIYIYEPDYTEWHSDWYWGYFPDWHTAWSPAYYHYYYGYHYNLFPVYHRHFRHWQYCRHQHYNDIYRTSIRVESPQVSTRITDGSYNVTYNHPEQRRNGETLYEETRSRREVTERTAGNTGSSGSTSPRRSGDATVTKNDPPSSGQATAPSRRPASPSVTTGTSRRPSGSSSGSAGSSTGNTRRPASNTSHSDPSDVQDENTFRRPPSEPATAPAPERRSERAEPSSQPERQSRPEPTYRQPERSSQPEPSYRQPERPSYQPASRPSEPERPSYQPERQPERRPEPQQQPSPPPPQPERSVEPPAPSPAREAAPAPAPSSPEPERERPVKPAREP